MTAPLESVNFEALDACHQQIVGHLNRLATLIQTIETSGLDEHTRQEAGAIEAFFSQTSRAHHAEEERSVFPPLLAGNNAEMVSAIRGLQQDHGWIEENWIELAPQLSAIALGNNWLDAAEFRHYAEVFLELCREHIALEESLIYPESKATWAKVLAARAARLASAPG
ncbi:MAG: hemerythrin domain-containing protein [Rhodoferax sp.]|nr:hemerythrin domain-containing protein [Rhodoferax sp.]MCF8209322.1 hemerythrin domain-containing protein [Rhodoferax sp.]